MISKVGTVVENDIQVSEELKRIKRRKKRREIIRKTILYIIISIGGILAMLPFLWMLSTSLKDSSVVFQIPPQWIPERFAWENYPNAIKAIPFIRYTFNSAFITVMKMIGEVFTAALVAYGFARFRFPGRRILFLILLATIMIPGEITLIPVFIMFKQIGWIDSFKPLIVPAFFGGSAVFIFFLRQYFASIPKELEEAARIDGCSSFQIFYKIFLPISKPALATIAIWSFQGSWNDLLGPLIYLNSLDKFTLQIGLTMYQSLNKVEWGQLMAASLLVLLPVLILFFSAQKYFTEGIKLTGIKG
ncbi:carbohydrate ABC transporter permease [Caloranaerobacter sp. TR13]|uniref:carbohydrate ABC transporter permease n=1 Tax=Caloranaerobacter sp. TR13 TaxID=1302151 RepID=UPI0009EC334B|nr:carbohydrate ABC transporter permease [Caloranaerobacter sp. TR13]